jgi:hypothetical protein
MFVYLLIKSILTAVLFVVLVPKLTFGLGVNGVAIAELLVNVVAITYLILNFPFKNNSPIVFNKKEYFKLLVFSLLETLIRNLIYYFVILVFLNIIDNQDLYFISNEYIWSIILVPTLAQSTLIKQDVANNKNFSLNPYLLNSIILILFMVVMIPISLIVFKYAYNLSNYLDYFVVMLKLLPCYTIFIVDSAIEAYFNASGKLHHILIQTILTNIVVYLFAFVLYLCGVWTITLNSILLLFNLGVLISSSYTIIAYIIENHRNKIINK